jgi:DMSO/TMAO reductase YedYZ molybdopterin-dependent catalytic subunit
MNKRSKRKCVTLVLLLLFSASFAFAETNQRHLSIEEVLAALGGREAAAKKQLREDAAFMVIAGDVEYKVTMEEFLTLEQREIQANYKKNGKDPETRGYTGVPFAEILRMKGIAPAGFGSAVFAAADGYASALPMEDALDEENCFIAADDGDGGPFRMILPKDRFSQRWCKLLTDVTLK